jgi:hypothetical protein
VRTEGARALRALRIPPEFPQAERLSLPPPAKSAPIRSAASAPAAGATWAYMFAVVATEKYPSWELTTSRRIPASSPSLDDVLPCAT